MKIEYNKNSLKLNKIQQKNFTSSYDCFSSGKYMVQVTTEICFTSTEKIKIRTFAMFCLYPWLVSSNLGKQIYAELKTRSIDCFCIKLLGNCEENCILSLEPVLSFKNQYHCLECNLNGCFASSWRYKCHKWINLGNWFIVKQWHFYTIEKEFDNVRYVKEEKQRTQNKRNSVVLFHLKT